jgi:hypothetical protein
MGASTQKLHRRKNYSAESCCESCCETCCEETGDGADGGGGYSGTCTETASQLSLAQTAWHTESG